MSTEIKKDKFYSNTCILILSAIVIILLVYIFFFTMFGTSVQNQLGWETTSNAIALVGLITSVITIIFVYKTYKSQREENDRLKRDAEFNRALDIMYKQLEHSNRLLEQKDMVNRLAILASEISDTKKPDSIENVIKKIWDVWVIIRDVNAMINIYRKVIDDKDFDGSEYDILKTIVKSGLHHQFLVDLNQIRLMLNVYALIPQFQTNIEQNTIIHLTFLNCVESLDAINLFFDNSIGV